LENNTSYEYSTIFSFIQMRRMGRIGMFGGGGEVGRGCCRHAILPNLDGYGEKKIAFSKLVEGLFHTYLYKCSSILFCSPTNLSNKNNT
jgi:hypothetical protein